MEEQFKQPVDSRLEVLLNKFNDLRNRREESAKLAM